MSQAGTTVIKQADSIQTAAPFRGFTFNQKLLLAQILCQKIRTGEYMPDAIDAADPDAELGEVGEEFALLHADEPSEALMGIVLSIVLSLR